MDNLSTDNRSISLRKSGEIDEAAQLLEEACSKPHIGKAQYRNLFKIWRKTNRGDLKCGNNIEVIERVRKMVRYDDEMIECMLEYWGRTQQRVLPPCYFDSDRNLKITDARLFFKAATAVGNPDTIDEARNLLNRFESIPSNTIAEQALDNQCKELGLPLDDLEIQVTGRVEEHVLDLYSKQGYIGSFCEGRGLLLVIKALVLEVLDKYNRFHRESASGGSVFLTV